MELNTDTSSLLEMAIAQQLQIILGTQRIVLKQGLDSASGGLLLGAIAGLQTLADCGDEEYEICLESDE